MQIYADFLQVLLYFSTLFDSSFLLEVLLFAGGAVAFDGLIITKISVISRKAIKIQKSGTFICKCHFFCVILQRKIINTGKVMCVLEQTATTTTVRLSNRRWARLQELDKAYRLAQTIKRSMKQVESAPSMSVDEAIETLRAL